MANRRDFLKLLAGSIAAASAGITLAPAITPSVEQSASVSPLAPLAPLRRVHARHLYWYSKDHDAWGHRIDVRYGDCQWGVDLISAEKQLDARSLEPALALLNDRIGGDGVEVGEIFTFSIDEWHANMPTQVRWSNLGVLPVM